MPQMVIGITLKLEFITSTDLLHVAHGTLIASAWALESFIIIIFTLLLHPIPPANSIHLFIVIITHRCENNMKEQVSIFQQLRYISAMLPWSSKHVWKLGLIAVVTHPSHFNAEQKRC